MTSTVRARVVARRRKIRLAAVGSTVVLLMALLGVWLLMANPGGSAGSAGVSSPAGRPAGPQVGGGDPVAPSGPGWVTLPGAGGQDQGFAVRFPHTPQGAAAAMAAMLRAAWTLDELQARRASAVYAHPTVRDEAVDGGADTTKDLRTQLGVPLTGDVPDGAYLTTTPIATHYQQDTPDQVRVAMMVQLDSGLNASAPHTKTLTIGGTWLWAPKVRGGDWTFTTDTGQANAIVPPLTTPGTPQHTNAGWLTINQEGHP